MSDKLITRSTGIVPADDFAKRVEEELGKRGEEPVQRVVGEQCFAELKAWAGIIQKCALGRSHAGQHHDGSGVFWANYCPRTSRYGTPCRYQNGHEGAHEDGGDFAWNSATEETYSTEEILGLIGSTIPAGSAFQQALAAKLARRAPIAQRVSPSLARSWQFGFGPVKIPAGASATTSVVTQALFRGEKLINTGDIDGLLIENIICGQRTQMPASTFGISVDAFSPNSLGSGLRMDTVQPGQSIVIVVRNAATEERTFSAVLIGKAVA